MAHFKEHYVSCMMQIPQWRQIINTNSSDDTTIPDGQEDGEVCYQLGKKSTKDEAIKWFLLGGMQQHRLCVKKLSVLYPWFSEILTKRKPKTKSEKSNKRVKRH